MIQRLKPKSEFSRNVLTLMTGTTIAQAIPIAISPILTRIYTPEDFGVFAVYASIVMVLLSISSLRYETSIPAIQKDAFVKNMILLSCLIVLSATVLLYMVIFAYGDQILNMLNIQAQSTALIWLIPLSVFFGGIYQIFTFWHIRDKNFKTLSKTQVKKSLFVSTVQLIGFKFGALSLMGSQITGQIIGAYFLVKHSPSILKTNIRFYSIKRIAKRYIKFPLFSSWASLLYALNINLPILLLTTFGFVEIAGLFMLAERILISPTSILSGSITQAVHKILADSKKDNSMGDKLSYLISKLIKIAVAPTILVIFIAPHFVGSIFGDEWQKSGVLVSYLAPFIALGFIFTPMSAVISIMEWQKHGLVYQFLSALFGFISLIYFLNIKEPLLAVLFYSLSRSVLIIIYRGILLKYLSVNLLNLAKVFLLHLFLFLLSMIIIYLLKENYSDNTGGLALLIILSVFSILLYVHMNVGIFSNRVKGSYMERFSGSNK